VQLEAKVFSFYFQIYTNLYRVYVTVLNIKNWKFIQILSSESIIILPWTDGSQKIFVIHWKPRSTSGLAVM
jgi:hypothetical protein